MNAAGENELRQRIQRLARPSLRLRSAYINENWSLVGGGSVFGGSPDLPKGFEWPRSGLHEKPLTFVMQLNLSSLARFGGRWPLPERGMLSFFYGGHFDYYEYINDNWQVIWFENAASLQLARFPEDLPERLRLPQHDLAAAFGYSVPNAYELEDPNPR